MKQTIKVRGKVECPGFIGKQRIVSFEFAGLVLLKFRHGVAKFSIHVPVGTTSILAKTAWTLAKRESVESPHFILLGGDLNEDNKSNSREVIKLRAALGTSDPAADINGDGVVDDADFNILKSNLGRVGDR